MKEETLSDKIHEYYPEEGGSADDWLYIDEVREAVKKLKEKIKDLLDPGIDPDGEWFEYHFKDIFGDKLI